MNDGDSQRGRAKEEKLELGKGVDLRAATAASRGLGVTRLAIVRDLSNKTVTL